MSNNAGAVFETSHAELAENPLVQRFVSRVLGHLGRVAQEPDNCPENRGEHLFSVFLVIDEVNEGACLGDQCFGQGFRSFCESALVLVEEQDEGFDEAHHVTWVLWQEFLDDF